LNEAKSKLAELVDEVASGEDVVITRSDRMSFRIVGTEEQKPTPTGGSARGLIKMADDFDEPLADFKPYES